MSFPNQSPKMTVRDLNHKESKARQTRGGATKETIQAKTARVDFEFSAATTGPGRFIDRESVEVVLGGAMVVIPLKKEARFLKSLRVTPVTPANF